MATASADMYPYNLFFQFIGLVGWLVVGMLWHDRSLIVLNAFGIAIILTGIMNYLI
jgi:multidrug transporter EmrE-like cation transporter